MLEVLLHLAYASAYYFAVSGRVRRWGLVAFTKLNIEAYPNPAPVILEITAQSAGLSAEEMERLTQSRSRSASLRRLG